jgi:cell division protein FtsB
MMNSTPKKYRLRNFAAISFFVVMIFYLTFHAINGDRGIIAFLKLSQTAVKLQNELDIARAERLHLEHRVNLMRSDSLDIDLLEEQVRKILGVAGGNEAVYFLEDKNL